MNGFIETISASFQANANEENAIAMSAYMKNNFEFFGIKTPERRTLCKQHLTEHALHSLGEVEAITKLLWQVPQREFQYYGIELMHYYRKWWKPSSLTLFKYCITNKSWWDSIDAIASDWIGEFMQMYPAKIPVTREWNQSSNMWLQRTSLLFQKRYKQNTDLALLSENILHLSSSKEFFIQKAIGWALREYAKVDEDWVKEFVHLHANILAALSKKEALKNVDNYKTSEE
ncbi:MAG: DNA alkylation repair protein [Ilyomonas sp.]